MEKADILKAELDSGKFDTEIWSDMATRMVSTVEDENAEIFRLADELNAVRKKRRDEEEYERKLQLRALNEERIAVAEKEREV